MTTENAATASAGIDSEKTHVVLEHALERPLTACHWDPKNRYLFVGLEDSGIVRFHLESKEPVPMVGPHDSWVRAIGTSPDGEVTYSGGYDGRLVWWPTDASKPEPIRAVDAHQGWIRALAVSQDGKQIATCGNDRAVRLWDSATGECLQTFEGHQWHVYNVLFSSNSDSLISCDLRGFVKVWPTQPDPPTSVNRDLLQVEALYKYDTQFRADIGGARCMTLSKDGARLAVGGITNVTNAFAGVGNIAVALVDVAESKVAMQWIAKDKVNGSAWGIAQHDAGFWIGLSGGGGGGWFYFWRDDKPEEFFKMKLKSDGRGMSLSPDQSRIAVAHADKNLRLYAMHAPH